MIIGTRQKFKKFSSEMNINIGGKNLTRVVPKKVLGIIIVDQLRWDEQIDNISNKYLKASARYDELNSLLKEKRFNFFIILWFNLILSIAPWFGATAANP
jgi:hypothetical protein